MKNKTHDTSRAIKRRKRSPPNGHRGVYGRDADIRHRREATRGIAKLAAPNQGEHGERVERNTHVLDTLRHVRRWLQYPRRDRVPFNYSNKTKRIVRVYSDGSGQEGMLWRSQNAVKAKKTKQPTPSRK